MNALLANVFEAAEQCGILAVPVVVRKSGWTVSWHNVPASECLVFCDEDAEIVDPVMALRSRPARLASLFWWGLRWVHAGRAGHDPQSFRGLAPVARAADPQGGYGCCGGLALVQAIHGDWTGTGVKEKVTLWPGLAIVGRPGDAYTKPNLSARALPQTDFRGLHGARYRRFDPS